MPQQSRVGTAYFRINGVPWALATELTMNPLRQRSTPQVGIDGSVAEQVEFLSPMIECQVRDRADVDLFSLHDIDDATIEVELANGTVWALSGAFFSGEGDFNAREGTYGVRFNGVEMSRVVGA